MVGATSRIPINQCERRLHTEYGLCRSLRRRHHSTSVLAAFVPGFASYSAQKHPDSGMNTNSQEHAFIFELVFSFVWHSLQIVLDSQLRLRLVKASRLA